MFGKLYLLSKSIIYAPMLSVFISPAYRNKNIVPSAVAHPDTAICSKNLPNSELLSSSWPLLLTSNKPNNHNNNNNIVSLSISKVKPIIKNIVIHKYKKDKHNDIYTTFYKNNNIINLDNKINYINNNNNINNNINSENIHIKYQFNQTPIDYKKHIQNLEFSKIINNFNQTYSVPSIFKNIKKIL